MSSIISDHRAAARQAALRHYDVLDTDTEPAFEDVVALAARVCKTPIALISLVDGNRQWFKSELGFGMRETPLEMSVCAVVLDLGGLVVIPDLQADGRFSYNPLVTAEEPVRFYAGHVLTTPKGVAIGTICVLHREPRPEGLDDTQAFTLEVLARHVVSLLENRRTQMERNDSEQRFKVLTDSMPQMIWTTLPDGFHDYYNRRWYEFTGTLDGSTDGEGWNGVFHPEDQERAWARWRYCLSTGDPYEIEYRLRHHTGEYRWVLGRAMPLRDEAGRIVRWFGTCTDIHEIKATEAALAESEVRFRTLVEVAPQIVWFSAPDGAITYVSPYWYDYTGSDLDSTIADGWAAAIREDLRDTVLGAWRASISAGTFWEFEFPLRRAADGQYRWFLARGQPIRDGEGRILQWAGIAIDIHERRQAEEARELLAGELAHRIKNIFAVVGSLISLSARGGEASVAAYAKDLRERLRNLAEAHEYVRPHSPVSRPQPISITLHGLMKTLLGAYLDGEGRSRIQVSGDNHPVAPKAATAMALIFHEHVTNAVKYGALAKEGGHITIETRLVGDDLEILWSEEGGPPIATVPNRNGFGTLLSDRSAKGQLGGSMVHEWRMTGLLATLRVPLGSLDQ